MNDIKEYTTNNRDDDLHRSFFKTLFTSMTEALKANGNAYQQWESEWNKVCSGNGDIKKLWELYRADGLL